MLNAGFIGLGRMGITHFSILNTHPSVKIAAVCDMSNTMINLLKKHVDIKIYSDYQKMINENSLDFVIISTPTDSHIELIKVAIDNNLHIFSEKPFALSPTDGRKVLAHMKGKSLVNQVGYVNRFNEIFNEVKKLLDSGAIGEIKNFSAEMYGASVLKDSKAGWRGKRRTGGGCIYEFASHCIDLIVYFLGHPDKVVGSIMQNIYSSSVEDLVSSTFLYNIGCSGTLVVNWSDESYRKPTFRFKFFGTKGKILADQHAYKIFLKDVDPEKGFRKGWNTRFITDFAKGVRFYVRGNEFTNQLDYFIDCIKENRVDNISSFEEANKTDIIIETIQQDAVNSLALDTGDDSLASSILSSPDKPTLWKKFSKFIEKNN